MTPLELRATASLASIYGLRLFGMFVILPVFALYAQTLPGGATHTEIGVALGAYGLLQALLQIPFGWASDRWGRKPVIYSGLAVFAIGSFIAASGASIVWVIAGRCLQGAGAISAAVVALTADLTRDVVRTRAMAAIGITIGATFAASIVAGPLLKGAIGVPGIFVMTGVLALAAIAVVHFAVPSVEGRARTPATAPGQLRAVLRDPQLLRLNYGTFALHAVLMALFTQVPFALRDNGLAAERHWVVYLPVLVVSVLLMLPFPASGGPAGPGQAAHDFGGRSPARVDLRACAVVAFGARTVRGAHDVLRSAQPARGHAAGARVEIRGERCPRRRDRRQLERTVPGCLRRGRGRWMARRALRQRRRLCIVCRADGALAGRNRDDVPARALRNQLFDGRNVIWRPSTR
jgi:MFS family permease